MKGEAWIWMGIKAVLAVAALTVITVGLKHISERMDIEAQAEIDTWVNQRLIEALSRKISQPTQLVGDTLKNPSTSPLAEQIEQTIKSATLMFRRLSSSRFRIQLALLYKDDTTFSAVTEKEWDDLPATVRREFLQTGNQIVNQNWSIFTDYSSVI